MATRGSEMLKAIETLSGVEQSLEHNTEVQGPGGEAYDMAPTPDVRSEEKYEGRKEATPASKVTESINTWNDRLGAATEKVLSAGTSAVGKIGQALEKPLAYTGEELSIASTRAKRIGVRTAGFMRRNWKLAAALGVFVAALEAGRRIGSKQ